MSETIDRVAREIGVEIFSERHGCLCDHATEDLQMNVRGHISLPAIARAAIASYEAASASRIRELEEALKLVMDAVDKARLVPKPGCGAGGQTIEANIRESDYLRVDAWQIECARAVLDAKKSPPARASGEVDASEPCRGNGGGSLTDRA